jgi:hypothetical protein
VSHKITVICDHGGGPGIGAAMVLLLILLATACHQAVGNAVHDLLTLALIIGAAVVILAAAVTATAIVIHRRRARTVTALPWRPRPVRPVLPPASRQARRVALQLPRQLPAARQVIPGQAEPVPEPARRTGGRRHARP